MLQRNKMKEMLLEAISKSFLGLKYIIPPQKGKRAVLGGSAIPRQPVARAKQASIPWPKSKNQFNISVRTLPNISDIKLIRTECFLSFLFIRVGVVESDLEASTGTERSPVSKALTDWRGDGSISGVGCDGMSTDEVGE